MYPFLEPFLAALSQIHIQTSSTFGRYSPLLITSNVIISIKEIFVSHLSSNNSLLASLSASAPAQGGTLLKTEASVILFKKIKRQI